MVSVQWIYGQFNQKLNSIIGSKEDVRQQYIYSAEMLTNAGLSAGVITELAINVVTKNSTGAADNFTIKMGCSSGADSVFASLLPPVNGSQEYMTTQGVVYGPVSYTSSLGWNTFTLSTPYDWDGTSHLIIEMCYNIFKLSFLNNK